MEKDLSISAYIIAGGKSKRFGSDKSQYMFNGKPLIRHVYDALTPVFSDIYVISNNENDQKINSIKIFKDIIPDLGPIGGLYTALSLDKGDKVFISACDIPFLNSGLVKYMVSVSAEYNITIPVVNNMYEPLHAIYSKNCLSYITSQIESGDKKIINFFDKTDMRIINENEINKFDKPERIFHNINYFEDIKKYESS